LRNQGKIQEIANSKRRRNFFLKREKIPLPPQGKNQKIKAKTEKVQIFLNQKLFLKTTHT
jgi:hypothetical protein